MLDLPLQICTDIYRAHNPEKMLLKLLALQPIDFLSCFNLNK